MSDRIKFFKRSARKYIYNNFISVFVVSVLILMSVSGGKNIAETIRFLLNNTVDSVLMFSDVVNTLIILFTVSPMFFVLIRMSPQSESESFEYKANKKTVLCSVKALSTKIIMLGTLLFILIATEHSFDRLYSIAFTHFSNDMARGMAEILKGVFFFIILIISSAGISCFACVPHLFAYGYTQSIKSALAESCAIMKGHKAEYTMLKLSFVPLYLFSYLFFCIPFIIVLPYAIISENIFVYYVLSHKKIPVIYSFSDEKE